MRHVSRPVLLLMIAAVAGLGALLTGCLPTVHVDVPAAGATRLPASVPLPDGFQPEGIAVGRGPFAYLGTRADGDILRVNLRNGKGKVVSQGPGTPSLGLKTDHRGRLLVAGGTGGDARVVDIHHGRVLARYRFASSNTFVNDVALTHRRAWFTDSLRPRLYAVPLGRHGRLPDASKVRTLPLSGDWVQRPGLNANGVARTPNHRALLVVQSVTGFLFRVDPHTGVARRVDLHGTLLTDGDGLLVRGRTLYAVQNQLNRIAVVRLNRSGSSGRLTDTLTSRAFDVPTTVAFFRGGLYLPNARFSTPPKPTTAYSVNRIEP